MKGDYAKATRSWRILNRPMAGGYRVATWALLLQEAMPILVVGLVGLAYWFSFKINT